MNKTLRFELEYPVLVNEEGVGESDGSERGGEESKWNGPEKHLTWTDPGRIRRRSGGE